MERGSDEETDREPEEDADREPEEKGDREPEDGDSNESRDTKGDDDTPGPSEPTEEEEKEQREKDAREAQERLEEVRDAPPEEHASLKADALGSTIILIGALFVIFGVIVALAFSPWGWVGVVIGVAEIIVGQVLRRGEFGGDGTK